MKNKPVVLIVSRRLIRKNKPINWVSEAHISMLMQQGLMPVTVPIVEESLLILENYMENMCGLLMVEGGDIIPSHYNQTYTMNELDEPDALKDQIELTVFKRARKLQIPVLGICRGIQIINIMMGGTLKSQDMKQVKHINYDDYDAHRHNITLVKNTPLHQWYGKENLMVNTYHHQGIDKLAPGLITMARADDGLIEAVYHPEHSFMVGLQFHPERMLNEYTGNLRVFEAFGSAIKNFATKSMLHGNY